MFASESPEFYAHLAAEREAMPVRTKPSDPKRGTFHLCTRCQGKGEARYNHRNGDTYCYLCGSTGWMLRLTATEQAAIEVEREWWSKAYYEGKDFTRRVGTITRRQFFDARGGYAHSEALEAEAEARVRRIRKTAGYWVTAIEGMNS